MSRDMELPGLTREVENYVEADRVSDGTVGTSRQQHAEAEMTRDEDFLRSVGITRHHWYDFLVRWFRAILHVFSPRVSMREYLLLRARLSQPVLREFSLTPTDDRLLIKYASFREGYVCAVCDGDGHGTMECSVCVGAKKVQWQDRLGNDKFEPCTNCRITGAEGREPKITGREPCANCTGTGLARGVLAVPDEAKRDHSYGDVISIGDQVYDLAPGDRVCFSKMAGIHIHNDKVDTNKRETHYCLLRRGEVMGLMLRV